MHRSRYVLETQSRGVKPEHPAFQKHNKTHHFLDPSRCLAGGVGISPFIDLLAGPIDSRRIKLVWAVRGDEYQALAAAIDLLRMIVY